MKAVRRVHGVAERHGAGERELRTDTLTCNGEGEKDELEETTTEHIEIKGKSEVIICRQSRRAFL